MFVFRLFGFQPNRFAPSSKKWPVNEDHKVGLLSVSLLSLLTTLIGTTYSPNVYISPHQTTPAAATSPPPLIFRTRPNHSHANPPESNTAGVINANPQLLAVYVERDRFADIQNVLRAFGLPPLLVCEDVLNESTSSRVSSHGDSSRVSSHRDTGLDGRSPQYSEYLELTESFSALSTSADTVPVTPFAARTGPVLGPGSSALVSAENKAKKYYVIIVGKCAGVYWNEWFVSPPSIYHDTNLNISSV